MSLDTRITNVNEYELTSTAEAFVDAISALAHRTETEGHAGVLSYQFFVDRTELTAAAIIVYADATAWVSHHKMAYEWPEMLELQSNVKLRRLTFLGPVDDTIRTMIDNAGISASVTWLDTLAAGFQR